MSITTATNLSVSNSATILGNTILGTDNTSTLIVNSVSTYNNGLVVINDIIHESGVYYGTSDHTYFNGDITINNGTFTSSTGKTTINSVLSEFYGTVAIIKNENGDNKLYLTNLTYSNFISLCHNGTGYLDFTDNFYIRGSGGVTEIINIEDNKISFKC